MADPKSKSKWPADKQAAYERLQADIARRFDELDALKTDATLVVTLNVHRGAYQSGRFNADREYA